MDVISLHRDLSPQHPFDVPSKCMTAIAIQPNRFAVGYHTTVWSTHFGFFCCCCWKLTRQCASSYVGASHCRGPFERGNLSIDFVVTVADSIQAAILTTFNSNPFTLVVWFLSRVYGPMRIDWHASGFWSRSVGFVFLFQANPTCF